MKVIWSRRVRRELHEVWLYLADRNIAYADRVERRITARGDSLAQFPRLGRPTRGSDLRELSVSDVQYVIVYRIEEDAVRILRLWHTAQDRRA